MENKDIDKAEREYSDKSNSPIPIVTDNAFRAGAEWMKTQMQSEIDELREALGDLKAAVESYDEQDEISIRLYEFVLDKATQLLERYDNRKSI